MDGLDLYRAARAHAPPPFQGRSSNSPTALEPRVPTPRTGSSRSLRTFDTSAEEDAIKTGILPDSVQMGPTGSEPTPSMPGIGCEISLLRAPPVIFSQELRTIADCRRSYEVGRRVDRARASAVSNRRRPSWAKLRVRTVSQKTPFLFRLTVEAAHPSRVTCPATARNPSDLEIRL